MTTGMMNKKGSYQKEKKRFILNFVKETNIAIILLFEKNKIIFLRKWFVTSNSDPEEERCRPDVPHVGPLVRVSRSVTAQSSPTFQLRSQTGKLSSLRLWGFGRPTGGSAPAGGAGTQSDWTPPATSCCPLTLSLPSGLLLSGKSFIIVSIGNQLGFYQGKPSLMLQTGLPIKKING